MSQRRPTVLVVDDDADILETLVEVLESENYAVQTARNGLEALESIRNHGMPELILLDMRMPVMDGWKFAAEFSARHDRMAPIVVMTAASDARKRAKDIQADGWVGKPFTIEHLLAIIECCLRGVRARRAI